MKSLIIAFIALLCFVMPSMSMADEEMYPITSGDKAFFEQIKKAVLADDFDSFAAAVAYPIELPEEDRFVDQPSQRKPARIWTKAELKRYKSAIFDKHLKDVVRSQAANSLFKNWQGVMVGDGELWFDQVIPKGQTNWIYRITAINELSFTAQSKKPHRSDSAVRP